MNVLVIGAGNEACGDDGAGPLVARMLDERGAAGIEVTPPGADGLSLIEEWNRYDGVVIVDAAVSGEPPGTIQRLDARRAPLPGSLRQVSSHGFGVLEVVELARALGRLPRRLTVFAIEGESFEPGDDVTPPVRAAASRVVEAILRLAADAVVTRV